MTVKRTGFCCKEEGNTLWVVMNRTNFDFCGFDILHKASQSKSATARPPAAAARVCHVWKNVGVFVVAPHL